jgi:hypothetical protein
MWENMLVIMLSFIFVFHGKHGQYNVMGIFKNLTSLFREHFRFFFKKKNLKVCWQWVNPKFLESFDF